MMLISKRSTGANMVFEWDDFGCNHVISDMCQSHDCRDQLVKLREINPDFKCTLFAIPAEMTPELGLWCLENASWVELAWHGFTHSSNYECEKMDYDTFDTTMSAFVNSPGPWKNVFRAPGWQISDDVIKWLADNGWILADQGYNDERRPHYLKAYVNYDGKFMVKGRGKEKEVQAYHGHTWDVGAKGNAPNGIYEDFDNVAHLVAECKEFKFVSEVVND